MPSLLTPEQLEEILSDLGPEFSALSDKRKRALCHNINVGLNVYRNIHATRREMTPHKRMEKFRKIVLTAEKLQAMLHEFALEMEVEIDRVRGNPPPSIPPTQDEVLEELSVDPRRAAMRGWRRINCTWPSRQAKKNSSASTRTFLPLSRWHKAVLATIVSERTAKESMTGIVILFLKLWLASTREHSVRKPLLVGKGHG